LQRAQDSTVTIATTTSNPQRARWGTRTAALIDSIVADEAILVIIIIVVVVVIYCVAAAEDGVGAAVAPLSSLAAAALSLIPLLNVRRWIVAPSHITIIVLPSVPTPLLSVVASRPC
jgi:hypothetical protein